MKLCLGISAAILVALTHAATVARKPDEMLKIPIETFNGPVRPSTVGRWAHALRKYGLSQRHSQYHHHRRPDGGGGGPRGRQRGGVEEDATNLARIPLVDHDFDREYYGTVMIGTPPQAFKIDFDTGSSQFIISSKECLECSGISHYDPSLSTTFRNISSPTASTAAKGKPKTWTITYGDQSHAQGILGHDHILLDNIRVHNQQLALITSESEGFDDTIDGIMGLAFGSLSTTIASTKTVFENMMSQGLVERGMFGVWLGKTSRGGGGEVIFGGMDLSKVEDGGEGGGGLTWTKVTKAKYWQIDVENVYVDGRVLSVDGGGDGKGKKGKKDGERKKNKGGRMEAIMDTGTTLMIVPENLASAIHQKIHGAQELGTSWALPCNLATSTSSTSKVELEIENKRFGIPFEDLVREETDVPGVCYSGIQSSTARFMIIGDVFIKNNYVVFDQEKRRVGIAPLKVEPRHEVVEPPKVVEVETQDPRGDNDGEGKAEEVSQAAGVASDEGTEEEGGERQGQIDESEQEVEAEQIEEEPEGEVEEKEEPDATG